ncbi:MULTISPECIES: LuxR C-terminal-related transcriptional regulator [unclassified Bradyrhizobium]|uniref:LuxR C-terminal-related transcriptional regulator n=1 Tax=unclassified Bradyrhizobium TaxID=2631580 RepID=UPI0033961584
MGVILKVSENTVNFHPKNAMRKLGTNSSIHCAVEPIRLRSEKLSHLEHCHALHGDRHRQTSAYGRGRATREHAPR